MKRTAFSAVMVSAALAVGSILFTPDAVAKKPVRYLTVDCDAGESLQAALDSDKVPAPVTVYVSGMCSDGPFRIYQDVKLVGAPSASLSASGGNSLVEVVRSSAEMQNLVLDAANMTVGVQVMNNSSAIIHDVAARNAAEPGINVDESSYALVSSSELSDNGLGLQVLGSGSAALIGTYIHDNGRGVSVSQFATLAVEGNTISANSDVGIEVSTGGTYGFVNTRVTPSTIENNGIDVFCAAGGVFVADQPQISATKTTTVDEDCRVIGAIF